MRNPIPPIPSGDIGRIFENLVENAYTAQTGGVLQTYLPVLDSHGVDRAVSVDGGPPLFIQIKYRRHRRSHAGLEFETVAAETGKYARWILVLVSGTTQRLEEAYVLSGPSWLRVAKSKLSSRGVALLKADINGNSARWAPYRVDPNALGGRLMDLAGFKQRAGPAVPRRRVEEGAYLELWLLATLMAADSRLVLYRPAVDNAGRDVCVQLAGTPNYLYVQVKGSREAPRRGHARFSVQRSTFKRDPSVVYVFVWSPGPGPPSCAWVVDAVELDSASANHNSTKIDFEPVVEGPDPVWALRRIPPSSVGAALLRRLV